MNSRFRPYRIILPRQGGSINIIQLTVYSFTVPALKLMNVKFCLFLATTAHCHDRAAIKIHITTFNRIKGGGGANGYFFVKLDFEIAVDQQTKTSDQTFEGVPDPNRQKVPAGQPRPYLVQIRPNLAKYPEHAQNPDFRCSTCS